MSIYITGDTHGGIDEAKLYSRYFKDSKKCTKEDYLIILGDWGYIFEYNPSDVESDEKFWRWKNYILEISLFRRESCWIICLQTKNILP